MYGQSKAQASPLKALLSYSTTTLSLGYLNYLISFYLYELRLKHVVSFINLFVSSPEKPDDRVRENLPERFHILYNIPQGLFIMSPDGDMSLQKYKSTMFFSLSAAKLPTARIFIIQRMDSSSVFNQWLLQIKQQTGVTHLDTPPSTCCAA